MPTKGIYKYVGQAFGTVECTPALGHLRVVAECLAPVSVPLFLIRLPADAYPGRQYMMPQVLASLPPTGGTQTSRLLDLTLALAWAVNQSMEDFSISFLSASGILLFNFKNIGLTGALAGCENMDYLGSQEPFKFLFNK